MENITLRNNTSPIPVSTRPQCSSAVPTLAVPGQSGGAAVGIVLRKSSALARYGKTAGLTEGLGRPLLIHSEDVAVGCHWSVADSRDDIPLVTLQLAGRCATWNAFPWSLRLTVIFLCFTCHHQPFLGASFVPVCHKGDMQIINGRWNSTVQATRQISIILEPEDSSIKGWVPGSEREINQPCCKNRHFSGPSSHSP